MFQNYLKIALRNLTKFKGYAAINIIGLAVGVAVCLLITLYVQGELRYDQHHADLDQLYRVNTSWVIDGNATKRPGSSSPVAKQIVEDFAEVEAATRMYKVPNAEEFVVKYQDQFAIEKRAAFVDSNFFELLTYDLIDGDPTTVLDQPSSIVLSKTMAQQLFRNENPVGKTLQLNCIFGESPYQVTGIFNEETYPSHLQAGFYAASRGGIIGQHYYEINEWAGMNIYYTFVKLAPNANAADLDAKFPAWLDKYAGAQLAEVGIEKGHFLQAVSDIYLDPEVPSRWFGQKGSRNSIYMLSVIAAFILLIACINFMNLATAKATVRGREVGVRKVLGADRKSLMAQFFSEAMVYATIAVALAGIIIWLALPYFNQLIINELNFDLLQLLPLAVVFIIAITLAAGSYPALYLSSFQPVKIFRNNFSNQLSGQQIRRGLVVLQFLIGVALIQGVLIINEQMNFIQNKALGFNPTAKVVIPLQSAPAQDNYDNLRQTLLQNPNVNAAGGTSNYPGKDNPNTYFYFKEGQTRDQGFMCLNSSVTPEYVEMMGFELLAGRFIDRQRMAYDTAHAAVITKAAMEGIGY
ncbi:MAG: ABC transporter permease, partial [Saprospiraceae bacterium]